MPTILRIGTYRFFFYAGDGNEQPHIHVERDNHIAEFWLDPVGIVKEGGFSATELNRIQKMVESHEEDLVNEWENFFEEE